MQQKALTQIFAGYPDKKIIRWWNELVRTIYYRYGIYWLITKRHLNVACNSIDEIMDSQHPQYLEYIYAVYPITMQSVFITTLILFGYRIQWINATHLPLFWKITFLALGQCHCGVWLWMLHLYWIKRSSSNHNNTQRMNVKFLLCISFKLSWLFNQRWRISPGKIHVYGNKNTLLEKLVCFTLCPVIKTATVDKKHHACRGDQKIFGMNTWFLKHQNGLIMLCLWCHIIETRSNGMNDTNN